MPADKRQTIKVRLMHRTSYPGVNWVEPVKWEPATDWANEDWLYERGALWSDEREEAGLAVSGYLDIENDEDDEIEVPVEDIYWMSSGDCRHLQDAQPC